MKRKTTRVLAKYVARLASPLLLVGQLCFCPSLAWAEKVSSPLPSPKEAEAIAEAGYIYGLPIVMNYAVMYDYAVNRDSDQYKAPFNQICNQASVFTYKDTSFVTPNSDTPYSFASLDLGAEPLVLSVPAVGKSRYYSVQLVDANTFNYGYIGSRTTGNEAGDYLVVGPDWKGTVPPGIKKIFHSSTRFSLALYRTQLFNAEDLGGVKKVQAGYQVRPLSAYLHKPTPPALPPIDFPPIDTERMQTHFFEYLDFALQFAPAVPEERDIRAQLARLGIGTGIGFHHKALPPEIQQAITQGMAAGEAKVAQALPTFGKAIHGWTILPLFGDRTFFHGDWLRRAVAAKAGIYGNDAEEAMYPGTRMLANGELLDGAHHDYTLTFPAGHYPPVNAFWSLTLYDGKTQMLIENPIDRYLINSAMLPKLQKNADGSLTISIQKDSPGQGKASNWLPAPDGPIYLVMRLYWPKPDALSMLSPGQKSWLPPFLVKMR